MDVIASVIAVVLMLLVPGAAVLWIAHHARRYPKD